MMIAAPETQFDLRFRALGIPVRVHPFFWLTAAMLGWRDQDLPLVAHWIACTFVSILIHEYGHGLMSRAFRDSPSILLWGMGGLCFTHDDRQSTRERLLVILAGPGAGFLFALVIMIVTSIVWGVTPAEHLGTVKELIGLGSTDFSIRDRTGPGWIAVTYVTLIYINIRWGLVNLLPIWPLDGGQAAQIVLTHFNRRNGRRWSHILGLLVSGSLAILVLLNSGSIFYIIFFGLFAVTNYQMLQALHQQQLWNNGSDENWWRR